MAIKAILACDANGGVGYKGTLPWPHIKRDFQWFKNNTVGHVVIMGSTTYLDPDMPKPMPQRVNVVATSDPTKCPLAAKYITGDLKEGVKKIASEFPELHTWVIGGQKVIEQTLDVIDEFYLSRIPGEFTCDTFLPIDIIETEFKKTFVEEHNDVTFEIWKRK